MNYDITEVAAVFTAAAGFREHMTYLQFVGFFKDSQMDLIQDVLLEANMIKEIYIAPDKYGFDPAPGRYEWVWIPDRSKGPRDC